MATSASNQLQVPSEQTFTRMLNNLKMKEQQLFQQYGNSNTNVDIEERLQTLKSSSQLVICDSAPKIAAKLEVDKKRQNAQANYDLIKEIKPMKISSEISDDKSLLNLIETLDYASNKLPTLRDTSSLSKMCRANVFIQSSDDAWIYSLDPSKDLILPLKREDIQTTCRICNSKVQTSTERPTDFLLCKKHQGELEKFAQTIKSIYGTEFDTSPPADRKQFHLNLYGPVLNRLNTFTQQLKTKAAESQQPDMKNIYEIMIDTNTMFKASIILYQRYLNPINVETFFHTIITILTFAADHQKQILEGLKAIQTIANKTLDLCLSLVTKLLALTRFLCQTFFSFFKIIFNVIFQNNFANHVWEDIASFWFPITMFILTKRISVSAVAIFGILYLTYKAYQTRNQSCAINVVIANEQLIID